MSTTHFFIRSEGKYVRINITEICYVEALKNYVRIITTSGTFMALISMRQIEEELPVAEFCRIHRSYLVALAFIKCFDNETLGLDNVTLPVSPAFRQLLHSKVRILISSSQIPEKLMTMESNN
jgi:two-component system, LytTR family, response regulator